MSIRMGLQGWVISARCFTSPQNSLETNQSSSFSTVSIRWYISTVSRLTELFAFARVLAGSQRIICSPWRYILYLQKILNYISSDVVYLDMIFADKGTARLCGRRKSEMHLITAFT